MQGIDKITQMLCGKPVLYHTIKAFEDCPMIDRIVVVCRKDRMDEIQNIAKRFHKVNLLVPGGKTRTESVFAGVCAVSEDCDYVAVHDGARPLVTNEVIVKAVEKAETFGAAAPAIPVKDTIKISTQGVVDKTLDRSKLFAIQTPQVFDVDLLRGALQSAIEKNIPLTDDCSAVEAIGGQVHLTDGSEENIKITTPFDLKIAKSILEGREIL
jgi:2-C-methyl-D-erythritol 4-phosphate cytidylyltransferase